MVETRLRTNQSFNDDGLNVAPELLNVHFTFLTEISEGKFKTTFVTHRVIHGILILHEVL